MSMPFVLGPGLLNLLSIWINDQFKGEKFPITAKHKSLFLNNKLNTHGVLGFWGFGVLGELFG